MKFYASYQVVGRLTVYNDKCKGILNPAKSSEHRHVNCRKSKEEISKALKGNNREDYLFGLK